MAPFKRLIGVIDLQSGQAVRAIGGQRHLYQPVESFHHPDGTTQPIHGNVDLLAECYHSVGIDNLYIADLDALQGGDVQFKEIHRLVNQTRGGRFYVDLGLSDRMLWDSPPWLTHLMSSPQVHPILATEIDSKSESHDCTSLIRACLRHCDIDRLVVSLDFRNGHFISHTRSAAEWFSACVGEGVQTVIALDLAAVGTGDSTLTITLCQQIRQSLPNMRLISGGGIRNAQDASRLLESGADELLVASLFVR